MPRTSIDKLKEWYRYDAGTGLFYRLKNSPKGGKQLSLTDPAGSVTTKGYITLSYEHNSVLAHVAAWAIIYGEWPTDQVDHRDGDRANNSMFNLRLATNAENAQNRRSLSKRNKSGHIGVYWHKRDKVWVASINRYTHIGYFQTLEEAVEARAKAKKVLHTFQPVQHYV